MKRQFLDSTLATLLTAGTLCGVLAGNAAGQNAPEKTSPQQTDIKTGITSISLSTYAGLGFEDYTIFNQDGTAARTTQTNETPNHQYQIIKMKGRIPALQFKRLVALTESVKFFDLERVYTSYDWNPSYNVEVVKGATTKNITIRDGNVWGGGQTPIGLWGLEMALRGIASDTKWEKVEAKEAEKK